MDVRALLLLLTLLPGLLLPVGRSLDFCVCAPDAGADAPVACEDRPCCAQAHDVECEASVSTDQRCDGCKRVAATETASTQSPLPTVLVWIDAQPVGPCWHARIAARDARVDARERWTYPTGPPRDRALTPLRI